MRDQNDQGNKTQKSTSPKNTKTRSLSLFHPGFTLHSIVRDGSGYWVLVFVWGGVLAFLPVSSFPDLSFSTRKISWWTRLVKRSLFVPCITKFARKSRSYRLHILALRWCIYEGREEKEAGWGQCPSEVANAAWLHAACTGAWHVY